MSLEPIAWANFVDDAGRVGKQEPGRFGRTFGARTLSVKLSGSMGTFSSATGQQRPYSLTDARSLYHSPLAMNAVAGTYAGMVRTVGLEQPLTRVDDFVIDEDGGFTTSAADCAYTGTLSQHGSTGVFEADATATGERCRFTAVLSGLVTPTQIEAGKPTFAFQLDSATGSDTAVFLITKQ